MNETATIASDFRSKWNVVPAISVQFSVDRVRPGICVMTVICVIEKMLVRIRIALHAFVIGRYVGFAHGP